MEAQDTGRGRVGEHCSALASLPISYWNINIEHTIPSPPVSVLMEMSG